jgi:hypothetical protein
MADLSPSPHPSPIKGEGANDALRALKNLPEYIAARLKKPFQWGANDCVLFAVGWAEIASGKKYLPPITWTNEEEALAALRELGGMEAAFDKHFTRIEPNFARDGDLAILNGTAYLFSGAHIVGIGKQGIVINSRLAAEAAWRAI